MQGEGTMTEVFIYSGDVSEWNDALPLYYSDKSVVIKPSEQFQPQFSAGKKIFLTLFGRTAHGESSAIVINDWFFYFYVRLSEVQSIDPEAEIQKLRQNLPRGTQFRLESRYMAYGFCCDSTGARARKHVIRLSFSATFRAHIARKYLVENRYEVCETDTFSSVHSKTFILAQFLEELSLPDQSCSWFSWIGIDASPVPTDAPRYTHCKNEFVVSFRSLRLLPPRFSVPKMRVLSFDIECYSPSDAVFPVADTCPIIAVGNCILEFDPCGESSVIGRTCLSFIDIKNCK